MENASQSVNFHGSKFAADVIIGHSFDKVFKEGDTTVLTYDDEDQLAKLRKLFDTAYDEMKALSDEYAKIVSAEATSNGSISFGHRPGLRRANRSVSVMLCTSARSDRREDSRVAPREDLRHELQDGRLKEGDGLLFI